MCITTWRIKWNRFSWNFLNIPMSRTHCSLVVQTTTLLQVHTYTHSTKVSLKSSVAKVTNCGLNHHHAVQATVNIHILSALSKQIIALTSMATVFFPVLFYKVKHLKLKFTLVLNPRYLGAPISTL